MTAKPSEGESVERGEGRDARVAKQAPTDARVRARRFETCENIYWLALTDASIGWVSVFARRGDSRRSPVAPR